MCNLLFSVLVASAIKLASSGNLKACVGSVKLDAVACCRSIYSNVDIL
jgi:hypothetical protein